ncbi:protein takeout-like [Arctopsyche grandis]|uniref:protein takeout-like n=1 Tax=Arctopsyche grandis TaxID=121162 RepID=UPI00406D9182
MLLVQHELLCRRGPFSAWHPDHFERCQVSEALDAKPNQCLKISIGKALKALANGDKALDIPQLDPLKLEHLTFERGGSRNAVNLDITLSNVGLLGFSNFVVKKLSSPKNWNMTLKGKLNQLQILGDYKMNGKVLILPIVGSGKCNITLCKFVDTGITQVFPFNKIYVYHINYLERKILNYTTKLDISIEIYGQPEIKNGQEYLKITHHQFKQELKRVYIYFGNLFNGDAALGETTNKLFNDNWTLVYMELRSTVEKGIAKVVEDYARNFMSKVPFKDIFIVES